MISTVCSETASTSAARRTYCAALKSSETKTGATTTLVFCGEKARASGSVTNYKSFIRTTRNTISTKLSKFKKCSKLLCKQVSYKRKEDWRQWTASSSMLSCSLQAKTKYNALLNVLTTSSSNLSKSNANWCATKARSRKPSRWSSSSWLVKLST